ncbi:RagB/SusD family nutrient uptake outer membrane protein [Pedobacter sp. PF22-3]|uniref:RagB/SusD family nutrient uptake outer membrane protein n=1 Tax=Pedobacter sp. PF22-3 TaxID=2994467 RepID=UPI0022465510|nr:RagB/SusD family nutrient uptake outer membrane protein [Pedobacter sp. PF22-3]MCX2495855.1 RagB/SusD family nutrient uptake outer membrane protein [Pedobacter sp. PF22-3]
MKAINKNIKLYILIFTIIFAASCKKDFLNVESPGQVPAESVWKDPATAQAFVNDIYNGLGNGGFSEQMLASVSDEALFTHPTRGIDLVNNATINPSTLGWVDDTWAYKQMYNRIRACNITIEKITSGDNGLSSQSLKDQLLGEAYFLRAYYYQQLLRYYGAVPLITKIYVLDDNYNVKRNTYEECVNFIVKDCDEASRLLTGKTLDKGRTTATAALALKSRVLIYAASDLHDRAKLTSKITGIAAQKLDFLSYASGSQADRYRLAQTAAKAVMDLGTGYKLNLSAPASVADGQLNYKSIAMGGASKAPGIDATAASDLIFARYFIIQNNIKHAQQNGPNGYHNWAGNTPIGLLVDDYEMKDGSKFSWTNTTQKANPYQDRDPRFYATILYDGAGWKPRDKASGNVDPASQIQTGIYDLMDNSGRIDFKGLDTRASSIENWNGSWTGYYYHKFIDPDPTIVDASMSQNVPWPFFRYTEAVFNYIEASIELGELNNATTWLNKIRFRAGMPAVTATDQDGLRAAYRHERRIEMAYEEQRYHDARRWLIANETLGRKTTYIKVTGKFKAGKTMSAPYHYDNTVYDYTYTPVTENAQENRSWDNKLYFRPFSRDEVNKNNLLEQNPGY